MKSLLSARAHINYDKRPEEEVVSKSSRAHLLSRTQQLVSNELSFLIVAFPFNCVHAT